MDTKLLIVDDDVNICGMLKLYFENEGYEVKTANDGAQGIADFKLFEPDLVLLDIMLPEEDGLSILQRLRHEAATAEVPVIMLTAKASEIDKVRGFELGADDYIPKPFGVMELVARVKARLRTRTAAAVPSEYCVGRLTVCPAKHQVKVDGEKITLTLKEYEMLCLLLENRNTVLTRDQILNTVWGYSFDGESRTVDVHIRTLRQKLGVCGDVIETVRGVGYRIAEETV